MTLSSWVHYPSGMTKTTIATWNVNSLRVRLPQLADWLSAAKPDIVALQETKLPDADFPAREIADLGYEVAFSGQRTYNGVAILSKKPLKVIATGIPGLEDEQRRVLAVETDGLVVLDLYIPNGQEPGSDKYAYKLRWLEALEAWLRGSLLGRQRARERAGASGLSKDSRYGARRRVSAIRTTGEVVQLVGLPRGGLPSQSRPAHRLDPRDDKTRRPLYRLSHRP